MFNTSIGYISFSAISDYGSISQITIAVNSQTNQMDWTMLILNISSKKVPRKLK